MNYPIGTKLKIIEAGHGAKGCNGCEGVVISKEGIDTSKGDGIISMDKAIAIQITKECGRMAHVGQIWGAWEEEAYKEKYHEDCDIVYRVIEHVFKVGDKVVPHSKSVKGWGDLENSVRWRQAKYKEQPYLYVVGIEKSGKEFLFACSINEEIGGGDYFLASDLTLYVEPDVAEGVTPFEEPKVAPKIEEDRDDLIPSYTITTFDEAGHKVIFNKRETIVILNIGEAYAGFKKGQKRKTFKAKAVYEEGANYPYSKELGYNIAMNKAVMRLCQHNLKHLMK